MSDGPQGPGWWMADDLKWYPPEVDLPATTPTGPGRPRSRWVIPVVVAVLIVGVGAGAWLLGRSSDDSASEPPTTTTSTTTTSTTTTEPSTTLAEPAPTVPPTQAGPIAPTGVVDLSDPLLGAYDSDTAAGFFSDPTSRQLLDEHLAEVTDATGVQWNDTMLLALAASYCNWLDPDDSSLTAADESAWAAEIAPVLGISTEAASTAINSYIWFNYAPCGD